MILIENLGQNADFLQKNADISKINIFSVLKLILSKNFCNSNHDIDIKLEQKY